MKKIALILLGTLLCAGAAGADMYVRGGFNGWGTDNLLVHKGKGVYEARVTLSPGNHPFKVGSGDWADEWTIRGVAATKVAVGAAYPMQKFPGQEGLLFVRQSADYTFSVDMSDLAAPVLRVARVEVPAARQADPHRGQRDRAALVYATFDGKRERVRFSSPDANAPLRSYTQSTTALLRDPGPQSVSYREAAGLPTVRSGSLAFDALFALAGAEMRQDSVAQIKDGNYNGGAAIDCDCFETGEKWHYVWTRDLSYAADLGLAMLDPQRVRNSLDFKLSPWRDGVPRAAQAAGDADGLQIIQDTGSGGSWPVSTDRVSWAFGAEQVLKSLPPAQRKAFAARALKALANTIANDRLAAFDKASGLYTGEQSFLDWRDQSYAAWIVNDLASMASAKALSTNVGHYKALQLAASLAREHGQGAQAAQYTAWALELKTAINERLWLSDAQMYSSLTAAHFDGAPMHKFDWLGQALAIVTGVASPERARAILAHYPHGPMGAPVIYPQQQGMPVYHNRAIWPFVTAYGLKAAAMAANVSVADAAYATLMRSAALNLSNMENFEWLSGQPLLLDEKHPELIGPVINSKRQLWSVGAYLGMVIENVFGVATSADGIVLRPFITARLRRETFGKSGVIALGGLQLQGKRVSVKIRLPKASAADGYYPVRTITLNGAATGAAISWDRLTADSVIEIALGPLEKGQQQIRRVSADPFAESEAVFGPREPASPVVLRDGAGKARLTLAPFAGSAASVYNIYRDGHPVASGVAPGAWIDHDGGMNACYALEAQYRQSGNRSHHSAPACTGQAAEIAVGDARMRSNLAPSAPGPRFAGRHLKQWGKPGDTFEVDEIRIAQAGNYQFQLRYHNGANQINLGISGGVKWMSLRDASGRVVASGVVQLPHARLEMAATPLVYSTPLAATLAPGHYTLALSDFYNMSYLQANSTFSAAGGANGASNRFDIHALRILQVN